MKQERGRQGGDRGETGETGGLEGDVPSALRSRTCVCNNCHLSDSYRIPMKEGVDGRRAIDADAFTQELVMHLLQSEQEYRHGTEVQVSIIYV